MVRRSKNTLLLAKMLYHWNKLLADVDVHYIDRVISYRATILKNIATV